MTKELKAKDLRQTERERLIQRKKTNSEPNEAQIAREMEK